MKDDVATMAGVRWALGVALLLASASAVGAQESEDATSRTPVPAAVSEHAEPAEGPDAGASAEAPIRKILVEALDVEGAGRDSVKRVVLSASRLVAGHEYTEQEIAQAVRRVQRLPFILDARPSLRRGSAPGKYTLLFVIEEHSPLTFGATGDHWVDGRENMSTGKVRPSLERFLGPLTQLHLSVDTGARRQRSLEAPGPTLESDTTPLTANAILGVTRYDVVGPASRLDLSFSAGRELCTVKDFLAERPLCNVGTGWGLESSLLVPSGGNAALTLFAGFQVYDSTDSVEVIVGEGGSPVRSLSPAEEFDVTTHRARFGAIWVRDTTDDPVAALEGSQLVAGLSVWLNDEDYKDYPYEERPFLEDLGGAILVSRLQRLFPLSRGFTVSAVAAPVGGLVSGDEETHAEASLGLRWVHAGRRNRYRVSLESGIIGRTGRGEGSRNWLPYASVRLRSGLFVIELDGRWAR